MPGANETSAVTEFQMREMRDEADALAFRTLNEEWIQRHFTLEHRDIEALSDPRGTVLARGGHIYMVAAGVQVVGCIALVPMPNQVWELSKMAVAPGMRGQGLGRKLLLHAIAEARRLGARSLFLGSNTKLADAVHLYESVGFRHVPPDQLPPLAYTRANVFMTMEL